MPDLAALLVEAGAASAEVLERALERQRARGGTLDTALLELEILPEEELMGFLSRASGLPLPPADLIEPDIRARRVFPARVAERHGLAPFRLEGRELSLLGVHPVDLSSLDEISFMLSLHLVPHVAPEWRVRELMARTYGLAFPDRLAALAQAVRSARGSRPAPAPSADMDADADSLSSPTEAPDADGADLVSSRPAIAAGTQSRAALGRPDVEDLVISLDDGFSVEPASALFGGAAGLAELDSRGPGRESEPIPTGDESPAARPPGADTRREEAEEPLAAALAQALSATDPEALLHEGAEPPSQRDAPPHWSLEEAFAALEAAQGREAVVAVALRYARDFFEAAALFAVTKERVCGQDAVGWEGARERCRSLRVTPDSIGLFRAVIETSGPYLGPIAREPGNDAMLSALGRPWPRIALAYPVALRERTVCVLYADNGDAPVSPRRLGDLLLLAAALGGAFERILRHAKRIRAVTPPLSGRPSFEGPLGQWEEKVAPESAGGREDRSEESPGAGPAAAGDLPVAGEASWMLRETGRAVEPSPSSVNGAPESFHVMPAGDALAPPVPFDPAEVVQRLCGTRRGSADRGRLLAQLVQRGPDAAAALWAAFPGPLDFPPSQAESEPVEERGPVLAALSALGIVATPYLINLLLEPDPERRRLASLLLGRGRDPAAFLPLADRAFDPATGVREAALGALARLRGDPDFRPVLERFRRALLEASPERAAPAASALARLGDAEAIPLLIDALGGPEGAGESACEALEVLTCRRFGRDSRRWLTWWKEHRGQQRADWLFAALAADDREVRVAAAERLREGGAPPLPWLADASPAERSEAIRAWRTWWDEHGHPV